MTKSNDSTISTSTAQQISSNDSSKFRKDVEQIVAESEKLRQVFVEMSKSLSETLRRFTSIEVELQTKADESQIRMETGGLSIEDRVSMQQTHRIFEHMVGEVSKLRNLMTASTKTSETVVSFFNNYVDKIFAICKSYILMLESKVYRPIEINTTEFVDHFVDGLSKRLTASSIDTEEQKSHVIQNYLEEFAPEVALIPAIRELQSQVRAEMEIPQIPEYPGKDGGVDPFEFLKSNFEKYIRQGNFGPGQLFRKDRALHSAISYRLSNEEPPRTIQDFFGEMRDPALATPNQRKYEAASLLLRCDWSEAGRFLGNMRGDRLPDRFDGNVPLALGWAR